jgi:curved DNA-binding protein
LNKQGERGDLFAQIKVVMPTHNDAEAQALWESLAKHAQFDPRANWSK